MTTYNFKAQFQNILRPCAYYLDGHGITPNQITVLTFLISVAYAVAMVLGQNSPWIFFAFPLLFLVRMALNAIDGIIAKEKNKITKLGAVLNEVCDALSDFALAAAFLFMGAVNVHLLWAFIYLSLFVECAGAWSHSVGGRRSFAGPLGKSDRGIILTLMAFAIGWGRLNSQDVSAFLEVVLVAALILLFLTILNRLKSVFGEK